MGCPGTQWDVTIQSVKTRLNFHSQNKSKVKLKLGAYFPLLAKERKSTVGQNFTDMVSIPPNWKTKAVLKVKQRMD